MSRTRYHRSPLVIAILTGTARTVSFGGNRANFRDLLVTAKRNRAIAYVVTVPQLQQGLSNQRVQGFAYDLRRKSWYEGNFPLPHVVYNRIPTRAQEKSIGAKDLIERLLKRSDMRLFNPEFFNKWQLSKWLSSSAELKEHVPQTVPLRNLLSVKEMLATGYPLFLKPVHGKAGAGMMRLEHQHKQTWTLSRQHTQGTLNRHYRTLRMLWRDIKRHVAGKTYVIQQYIELERSPAGTPFDLRVLLQKNSDGQWTVTGIGARVAGRNRLTTHVPRGGKIASPLRLLRVKYGDNQAKHLLRETGKLAVRIAAHLEKQSGQRLGELSMDIGLDRHAKLWFFEANSHPMKFDEPAIRRRSLRKWVRYCRHLANRN